MATAAFFPRLFEPAEIGGLRLKNRLVMAPMATNYASDQGAVTQRLVDYYAERARGGAGLLIVEITCVNPSGRLLERQLCIHDDHFIPGCRQLAETVKGLGARIAMQLHHAGRRSPSRLTGTPPVAPSAIAEYSGEMPRRLTVAEIEALAVDYGKAAKRAREAGFDAVEIHCAHGYLVGQFLSPLSNRRSDRYGGGLQGRMRFLFDILSAIKEKAGADYQVICRISGDEGVEGGLTLEHMKEVARVLEREGVAAIHVSAGTVVSTEEQYRKQRLLQMPAMGTPPGCFSYLAEGIKGAVSIPVIAVGRINRPAVAERILEEGKADLVAIGRGLIADPYWPQKAAEGRVDDIRTCIGCLVCNTTLYVENAVSCAINPAAGKENAYRMQPAARPKRILVLGGGPAGMESARVAALRGHQVDLWEKSTALGGSLIPAAALESKREIMGFARFLSSQLDKAGVQVSLNRHVTIKDVMTHRPDVVVVATGAGSKMPEIPGIDRKSAVDAVAVLKRNAKTGRRVVVVGGGLIGCETAALLAEEGKQVVLATRRGADELAPDMVPLIRRHFFSQVWSGLGIRVEPYTQFAEVVDDGLIVADKNGGRRLIPCDTVVFALGLASEQTLAPALKGLVPEVYVIGDAVEPRKIRDAVREGWDTGAKI